MVRERFLFGDDGWFERVGDMGVWAGGYVGGCVVLVGMGLGVAVEWFLVAGGFLLAVSVYLVHRVGLPKWCRRKWDGGDRRTLTPALSLEGRGGRFLFLWRYVGLMRGLAVATAVGAGVCLGMVSWWLVGLVVGAEVGILVYGVWRVGGKRVKDRLVVKNLAVAGAMVGFSVIVLLPTAGIEWGRMVVVGIFLLGQVFGDAMLCDLDDLEWDRVYGSRTIPVVYGERATWMMAVGLKVVLIVGGLGYWVWGGGEFRGLAVVGGGMVLGVVWMWIVRPRLVRDWVDLILPGAVGLVWFWG